MLGGAHPAGDAVHDDAEPDVAHGWAPLRRTKVARMVIAMAAIVNVQDRADRVSSKRRSRSQRS
jgi:hypothetical protein